MPIDYERLEKDFTYHAPKDNQSAKYEMIRSDAKDFARMVMDFCPPSRETSLALTKIEEAVFWANAAIARNE